MGPGILVRVRGIHALLRREVRRVIREHHEPVVVEQVRDDRLEDALVAARERARRDEVHRAAQVLVALVELGRLVSGRPQRLDLGLAHSEQEEVVVADELADLDVRAVVGADRERAVEGELHVSGAGCLLAGERDLL